MTRPGNTHQIPFLALFLLFISACESQNTPAVTPAAQRTVARPPFQLPGIGLDTVASGLNVPWSLAFAPDGRIFLTERVGRIRIVDDRGLQPEPWAALPVYAEEPHINPESGLMGVAIAPDFPETGHVYVMGTFWKRPGGKWTRRFDRLYRRMVSAFSESAALPYENRVYRLTDRSGHGTDAAMVIDGLPANHYHAGGALAFGPDGALYLSNGEALLTAHVGKRENLLGTILRYTTDGAIPGDNPFPGSPVFAFGTRNVQGLAWEPRTSVLFAVDHGPSFLPHEQGRSGKDELNVVAAGTNLGWPAVAGRSADSRYTEPVTEWTPAIAPAGLAFYTGSYLPWRNNAFVGGLRGQQLRRVALEQDSAGAGAWRVLQEEVVISQVLGRIRAVRMGPDGFLYITTSNRDGRGLPAPGDDLLLRLRPGSPAAPDR